MLFGIAGSHKRTMLHSFVLRDHNQMWVVELTDYPVYYNCGANSITILIYDRDVTKAALLAVQHPNAAGKVYNVSDGHFHTLKEIINAICQALGRKPPRLSLPVGPARFMAGLMEDTFRLVGRKSPISRDTIEKYTEDISVDNQLIQRELGFRPQFDLKAGWQETVEEMRKMGQL